MQTLSDTCLFWHGFIAGYTSRKCSCTELEHDIYKRTNSYLIIFVWAYIHTCMHPNALVENFFGGANKRTDGDFLDMESIGLPWCFPKARHVLVLGKLLSSLNQKQSCEIVSQKFEGCLLHCSYRNQDAAFPGHMKFFFCLTL